MENATDEGFARYYWLIPILLLFLIYGVVEFWDYYYDEGDIFEKIKKDKK